MSGIPCPNSCLDKHLGNKASASSPSSRSTPRQPHEARPQSRLSRGRPRHPVSAGHQGHAEGNAAGRRPATDSARRRRGPRGRHRAFHLRHRPQQGRHRGPFRPPVRAGDDVARAPEAQGARSCSAQDLPTPGSTSFTRQQEPLGLGHAVWCARELVGREPFALLLPDVLVQHERGCLAQMMDAARGLSASGQYRRRRGSAARARRSIRRGRRRRAQGQDVLDHQHGGEAARATARRRT